MNCLLAGVFLDALGERREVGILAAPSPIAAAPSMPAGSRDGLTDGLPIAHAFTVDQLVELVRAGLATATPERIRMGSREIEVARVRFTDEGDGR